MNTTTTATTTTTTDVPFLDVHQCIDCGVYRVDVLFDGDLCEDCCETDDDDACPGCGCQPGDGVTVGCTHPDGCGFDGVVLTRKAGK